METIFDHNPTKAELGRIFPGGMRLFNEIGGYKGFKHQDDIFYHLGLLFSMRGNAQKANEYWNKIEDKRLLSTLIEDF